MAENVKIPVELDLNQLNDSFKDLSKDLNKKCDEITKNVKSSSSSMAKDTKNSFKDASTAANKSQDTIAKKSKEINNTISKQTKKSTDKMKKSFSDMASNVSKKMTSIGNTMSKKVTAPIMAGFAGLTAVFTKFDKALDQIRIGTGATGEDLEGLYQSAKNLYGTLPKNLEEVSTAIADLNTRTGLTGEPLEELAKTILNLTKITGEDLNTAITNSTRLFGDWGVPVEDYTSTLDSLFKTSQSTGIAVNALMSVMTQYGSPLRQMGFTFEETAAMLGKFEKEGVNTSVVLSSLRIALGNFAKGGVKDTKAELWKTIDAIKKMKSTGEATAKAMEVFGAKAGPDMAAAIREGRLDVEELIESIANGTDTINGLAEETMSFPERLKILGNKLLVALEPLGNSIANLIEKAMPSIEKIINKISEMVDTFTGLDAGKQKFIVMSAGILAAAGPIISTLGGIIGVVGKLSKSFSGIGSIVSKAMGNTTSTMAVAKLGVVKNLGLMGKAVGLLTNPWIAVPAVVGAGALFVSHRTKKLKEELEENLARTEEVIMGVGVAYEELTPTVQKATQEIKNANIKIFNNDKQLQSNVIKAFEGIELCITEGVGNAQTLINNLFAEMDLWAPNLSVDEQKALNSYIESVMIPMIRAEEFTIEEAKALEKRLSEILGLEVDFKIDIAEADLQVKKAFQEIDNVINKEKGIFGFGFDIFGNKKNNVASAIKEQLAEIGKIDAKNLDIAKVVDGLTTSLEQSGLSAKKQKKIFMDLGQTLATSFDGETGAKIFDDLAKSAELSAEEINNFIATTTEGFSDLDTEGRAKIADFIGNIEEVKSKTEELLQGNIGALHQVVNENSEVWGTIVADNLKGSEDIAKTLEDFGVDMVSALRTMEPELRETATNWLSEMLGEVERQGGATKDEIAKVTEYINSQLNTIEGNTATVDVETQTATQKLSDLDTAISSFMGENSIYSAELLLNDYNFMYAMDAAESRILQYSNANPETPIDLDTVVFGEKMTDIMNKIDGYEKSNPTTDVKASVENAKKGLQAVVSYIEKIKKNNNLSIAVKTTTTETKKVITEEVKGTPAKASLMTAKASLEGIANTMIAPISYARDSLMTASRSASGQVSQLTASSIRMPEIKSGTVDKKKLNDANKMVRTKKEKSATIETIINLDGNVIARLISDKVDTRNGTKFIAKQRRFA